MKNILLSYRRGLICARYNWKLILLLYLMNLFMMFIAMGPMSNLMKRVLGHSMELDTFSKGFNYTTFMDLINNSGDAFGISISAMFAMFIPYALWIVFSSGGIIEVAKTYSVRSSLFLFWKGAATYFFRFFRLTIYVLIINGLIGFILFKIFMKDGLSPFDFDSEQILISRFWLLSAIFIFLGFFITSFRDLTKVIIGHHDELFITQSLKESFFRIFKPRFMFLSLLNIAVLLLLFAVYLVLKKLTGQSFWVGIVVAQIFLLFRMAYRIVRVASFEQLYKLEESKVFS